MENTKSDTIDKCSFYRLLEREVRHPNFYGRAKAICSDFDITEDSIVDSIFLLIDEVEEVTDLAAELDKIPNKFTKYTEVKFHVTQIASVIERCMRFVPDGNLSAESIKSLQQPLRDYVRGTKKLPEKTTD